ncbi:hypothetical protein PRECH8_12190 [Insulibacter thermoxylanivorax]|uniref:Uncharacterized protein n=1 Tax=Insulibacter thermoxylanivorax TaxID=2749268 RepID=A0A916QF48_9BACL|nr:hypothetical protein [Insulibacter thermoxylanivorax]GFR37923.1 hypothetical protein PRECH8_12190 [Insulibacter thermoxylanivorax]
MRNILVTVLLLIVTVSLCYAVFYSDDGLHAILERSEPKITERMMKLSP